MAKETARYWPQAKDLSFGIGYLTQVKYSSTLGFTATAGDMTRLAFIPVGEGDELEVQQEGFFQAPGVAANGQRFSFSDSDPFGNQWLNVWETASRQQDKLIRHNGVVAMGWSPASDQLAYIGPTEPAPSFYGPLSLLNLGSGKTEELTPDTVLAFFWSPNGRSIAYITLDSIVEPGEEQPAGPVRIDLDLSAS